MSRPQLGEGMVVSVPVPVATYASSPLHTEPWGLW